MKIGRTHTQDATPLTLGQEFGGYATQVCSLPNLKVMCSQEFFFKNLDPHVRRLSMDLIESHALYPASIRFDK